MNNAMKKLLESVNKLGMFQCMSKLKPPNGINWKNKRNFLIYNILKFLNCKYIELKMTLNVHCFFLAPCTFLGFPIVTIAISIL